MKIPLPKSEAVGGISRILLNFKKQVWPLEFGVYAVFYVILKKIGAKHNFSGLLAVLLSNI